MSNMTHSNDNDERTNDHRTGALDAATERRIELKEAVSQVETAAAAPAGLPDWTKNLVSELEDLARALDQHVAEVEGEDGLLRELIERSPRLVNKIARVQEEHPTLCRRARAAIQLATSTNDAELVRVAVLDLLVAVARHRQRGSDLVYEAYSVDIGGG